MNYDQYHFFILFYVTIFVVCSTCSWLALVVKERCFGGDFYNSVSW